jgi:PAS domain S-box-containing protein
MLPRAHVTDGVRASIPRRVSEAEPTIAVNTSNAEELRAIELLRRLTDQLSDATDVQTALQLVSTTAMQFCASHRATVHVRNDGDSTLRLSMALGFGAAPLQALDTLLAEHDCSAHRAARTRAPVAIEDFEAQPTLAEARLAPQLGYRASESVPLLDADQHCIATFTFYFDAPHRASERELSWIEMYARQATHLAKRTRVESAIRVSEQRFRSIFQESNDFIVTADLAQKITYCNPATVAALGWHAEDIVGHSISEFIPAPHFDRTSSMLGQKLRDGGSTRYEVDVIARDGRRMTWEINSRLTFGPEGKPTGLHAIGRDVTMMREAHEALRSSERALREADQRKDEFLAMLAHELRNPLAPIRTAAQILKQAKADISQVREASQIVERQVEHVTRIVDDLLDVSRVTRGLVTLELKPTSLHDVVRTAVEQVRPLVEARRHTLHVKLPDEPVVLSGEAVRLVQIVSNLLSNAARHSGAEGRIDLFVVAHLQLVEIHVCDYGIGIEPELLPRVFDLFTQADRSPARSEGGLGIGLALVRRLAELHGGHAEARSAGLGHGAEFTVVLPRLADETHTSTEMPATAAPHLPQALRILIVDDNQDAANMLSMLLQMEGHETFVEYAALAALARARVERPDVMLLDIGLPEMNGYELARLLRAYPETSTAYLIAVTGYGQEDDLRQSREAGFAHHLMKPVSAEDLRRVLSSAAERRNRG